VIWYQLLVGDVTKRMPPDYQRKVDASIVGQDFLAVLGDCVASDRADRIEDAGTLADRLEVCFRTSDVRWQQQQTKEREEQEQDDWTGIHQGSGRSIAVYHQFLARWPNGRYASQAQSEITQLTEAARRRRKVATYWMGFVLGGAISGFTVFGGIGALIGAIGWTTIVFPILGLLAGAIVGHILCLLLGLAFAIL
jgi:hypothetical protein